VASKIPLIRRTTAETGGSGLAAVTFSEVAPRADTEAICGFGLESPKAGETSDAYAVKLAGWALGRHQPAVAFEIVSGSLHLGTFPLALRRPDVAADYPDVRWAASDCGFRISIGALWLPRDFHLDIVVSLADGTRVPLATVRGERETLPPDPSAIQPILLTTLGRSGSNWMIRMLGQHPDILTYAPISETKVASYWARVLLELSEPASYLSSVALAISGGDKWWLGRERRYDDDLEDTDLEDWLGRVQVEELAGFCRGRIDAFYRHLAELEGKKRPSYFAEKRLPRSPEDAVILHELYPNTREVFLVRDFRDMLCSIFAFNARLGYPYFGRDQAGSDEEYIRNFIGHDVRELAETWSKNSNNAYLVRYEDLVEQPEQTLRSLLSYLDVDANDRIIDRLLGSARSTGEQRGHGTSSSARDSVGRWRNELEASLRSVCEKEFGDALETFGYSS